MSSAVHSHGTTFNWDGVDIAEIDTINGIEVTMSSVDVTNHQSADHFTESIPGLLTAGDVSLVGNYIYSDTTGQQALLTDMLARSVKTGIITFPASTGTTWTFSGYPTACKIGDATVDGKIPFTATIHPTGKPTLATATSTGLTTPFFAISESAVITPDPANDEYDYVATVATEITSVTVTPTATAGTITVNGNTVATGEASSAITLGAAGTNTTVTIVVTETSKAPVTYTVRVARASS
ncbi:MAG: phage tail tube protein [Eubacteriales bacterium]|nr:phage tail tube protein [Eubacteriales bacterium]